MTLVFNAGSSSLKYKLFDSSLEQVASGACTEIGSQDSVFFDGEKRDKRAIASHKEAVGMILDALEGQVIERVGHRVVHGGDRREPVKVTQQTLEELDALTQLAPLHNHRAVVVMRASLERMKDCEHDAFFDTMFHATLPEYIYTYPLPRESKIRKWGFHGLSHEFVARAAAGHLRRPLKELKLITLHLGNGSSACAIQHGRSLDTSMGLTPASGLPGGTRSGDIDPFAVFHLLSSQEVELSKAEHVLNKESGFKGLCNSTHMADIVDRAAGNDPDAQLTLAIFCNRLQNFIGAYFVALEGVDAIVFTGGIGEHASFVRQQVVAKLQCIGCVIDKDKNAADAVDISHPEATIKTLVIETNEELRIAELMAAAKK
ncbi:acetate kinase [Fennellomyces sp. T-0311]|nr:acetate kinase [Fennellomyces sp. T-0311]